MAELKTQKNNGNILEFLNLVEHKTKKACFYINKLTDINKETLKQLIKQNLSYAA
ncbi:MAG: hypothetical protein HRU38_09180 [Saccharospirillaceae bacterium]|nr:DUF1801 domain-containing protein [Pseudomonadales bacterium]NRB78827.1 hypothetical protein [Saccharospirillaceae bacterium]